MKLNAIAIKLIEAVGDDRKFKVEYSGNIVTLWCYKYVDDFIGSIEDSFDFFVHDSDEDSDSKLKDALEFIESKKDSKWQTYQYIEQRRQVVMSGL